MTFAKIISEVYRSRQKTKFFTIEKFLFYFFKFGINIRWFNYGFILEGDSNKIIFVLKD